MVKVTHKGLWLDFSSLNKDDKKIINKLMFCAVLTGFLIGFSMSDTSFFLSLCDNYPVLLYFTPLITIFLLILTIYYSFKFYNNQDELYQKYHDFTLMSGCVGFFFFGMILQFVNLFNGYILVFMDYFFCALIGTIFGQMYFYKKYY